MIEECVIARRSSRPLSSRNIGRSGTLWVPPKKFMLVLIFDKVVPTILEWMPRTNSLLICSRLVLHQYFTIGVLSEVDWMEKQFGHGVWRLFMIRGICKFVTSLQIVIMIWMSRIWDSLLWSKDCSIEQYISFIAEFHKQHYWS